MTQDIFFSADEPFFAGHFPGRPVTPGVVLVDRAVAAARRLIGPGYVLRRIERVRFTGPVLPGDSVTLSLEERGEGAIGYSFAKEGAPCASGTLIFVREGATVI